MSLARAKSLITQIGKNPGQATDLAHRALMELDLPILPELDAHGIIVVPGLAAVVHPGAGVTLGPQVRVEWPGGKGKVVALFTGTIDGDPATLDKMALRISINGTHELFSDSNAPAYVPLKALQPATRNWFRLRDTIVEPNQKWLVQFANSAVGGGDYTPYLLFAYQRINEAGAAGSESL